MTMLSTRVASAEWLRNGCSIWMNRHGGDRINHGAHLAGAAYGVLVMLLMRPGFLQHFIAELRGPRLGN